MENEEKRLDKITDELLALDQNIHESELLTEAIDLICMPSDKISEKQRQTALSKINQVLEINPRNTEALYWKAMYYYDAKNSIPLLEEIIAIDPQSSDAQLAQDIIKDLRKFESWKIDYDVLNGECQKQEDSYAFLDKLPCEWLFGIKIIVFLAILFGLFKPLILSYNDNKILKITDTSTLKELEVNSPSEYNFLSKDDIYRIRKKHVKYSIFAKENYEPSEKVFGAIVDYKPWWGSMRCQPLNYKGDRHEYIEGASIQSTQINNPNTLVGLSSPYILWDIEQYQEFCTSEYAKFIPQSINYSEKDNLIVTKYEVSKHFPKIRTNVNGKTVRYLIQLSGLNALDFGYQYVYAYDTQNIKMYDENSNITQNEQTFKDYIHLGSSCGYEGGCNNISPMQYDKMFSVTDLPAEINLKLWKNKPHSKFQKADMYYRIIFTAN